jgi:ABC-type transport system involved in cytochrome c biogenesis permease subunit
MAPMTYMVFGLGVALLWLAALAALAYLYGANNLRLIRIAAMITWPALLLLAAAYVMRFVSLGAPPLTAPADLILLFVLMATTTAIAVSRQARFHALLVFYLPPLALMAGLCAALAVRGFGAAPSSREISQALLVAHVGLVFQAFALFFIASLTSVAYVFQARRLKQRRTSGLFQKLPSLEDLDRTLHVLVLVGYPTFVATLLIGLAWARFVTDTLSPNWWFSPKIALSFVMVLFYAACFHSRSLGWLRGPKLAYFVFFGFSTLLGSYLLLAILQLFDFNFRGAGI